MPMRLLLDAHLAPALAGALTAAGLNTAALRDWQGGAFRSAPDEAVVEAALVDQRVLVTYDLRTIPALLKEWAETGRSHGGVILVDDATIRPAEVGRLQRALLALREQMGDAPWRDRTVFLPAR